MACLNCGTEFSPTANYCFRCGQDTSITRMNTKHAIHQFFHAFTHTDRGFLHLIPNLVTKPGIVSREYNQGMRKSYFSPFTFILIIVAISTILVSSTNLMTIPYNSQTVPQAQSIGNFVNKHFNIMVFISIPLIAYYSTRFFSKSGMNFSEAVVLVSYTSGIRSIFFIILVVPMVLAFKVHYFLIIYSYLALFTFYYGWACCQYLGNYKILNFVKGILSVILSQLTVIILITLVIAVSIFINRFASNRPTT